MRCLLCNKNEATQTGAHIFPAWMIASAFDIKSRTRDHEIIYAMYGFDSGIPYFGNSVQNEKIVDQIGRALTDDEIARQKNYLTVDNLWCRQCEKKITIIEEYFLENVDRKLTDFSNCNNSEIIELPHANKYIIRLFIYSLLLRAHLSKFMGFRLNHRALKKIKYYLNHYVQESIKETVDFIDASYRKDQLLKYPIRVFKAEQEKNHEGWIFINRKDYKPYTLIINEYFLQFYGRGNQANFRPESFFGISSIITQMDDIKNYKEEVFKIALINLTCYRTIKKQYLDHVTKIKMNNLIQMFILLFRRKFKHSPTHEMISIFLKELLENELPLGIKYSKEMIVAALNRTVVKINSLP